MGRPADNLARAVHGLGGLSGVLSVEPSPVYETEPQLVREQPWFANQVARVLCGPQTTPLGLLEDLLALETELGRERRTAQEGRALRYGPRVIDMDLLLFADVVMASQRLTLPHPAMLDRAFVLLPLADLAPGLIIPGTETTVAGALGKVVFRREGNRIWQG